MSDNLQIMVIVVTGLGSMGKRRIRLLKKYFDNIHLDEGSFDIIGIDSRKDRCIEVEEQYGIKTAGSLDSVLSDTSADIVFASTSPLYHSEIIKKGLLADTHIFSEINLVSDGYEDSIKLASERGRVLFLSSTPMYRKEMQYIKSNCGSGFCGTYQYHLGQFLPEWHPWENYRNFFASDKRTNGCRELFAIELPWILDVFGDVKSIHSLHNKTSDLEIEYDDTYQVIIEHATGTIGSLSVDVVSPEAERNLKIWNKDICIEWKGTPETLSLYEKDKDKRSYPELYPEKIHDDNYASFVLENAYYDEIAEFFECIETGKKGRYSFEKDRRVLELIDKIEA